MRESRQDRIELQEIDPESFRELLNLLYGYKIRLSGIPTLRLLSLIRRFEVREISSPEISQEEIFEFIGITEEIYGEHPGWLMGHFFDMIRPPIELQKYFNETYWVEDEEK